MTGLVRQTEAPSPERDAALPVIPENIPKSMRDERRWVVWNYEWREPKNGKPGDWTKVPYVATTPERKASSTDSTTWRSFTDAFAAYEDGKCDGIGFALGDGWMGFDADDTHAQEYVTLLDSYAERSPSGEGVHVIMRGTKPGPLSRKGQFELYDHGRYFTVTGQHLAGAPTTVNERTAQIAALYAKVFPNGNGSKPTPDAQAKSSSHLTDEQLVTKASACRQWGEKFARLFRGDTSGYQSHSEADLAFCTKLAYWSNRDAAQIERIFRKSQLMRDKFEREDYRRELIAKAIASTSRVYEGATHTETVEDIQAFLERVDQQPPLSFLVADLIPDEGICLWHGQPRDFKTFCAIEVALALAAGRAAFSCPRFAVAKPMKVAYFTEEDSERLVAARLHWLTRKCRASTPGLSIFLALRTPEAPEQIQALN